MHAYIKLLMPFQYHSGSMRLLSGPAGRRLLQLLIRSSVGLYLLCSISIRSRTILRQEVWSILIVLLDLFLIIFTLRIFSISPRSLTLKSFLKDNLNQFTCIIKLAATQISLTYTRRRIPLLSWIRKQGSTVYCLNPIPSKALINFSYQSLAACLRLQRLRSTQSTFAFRQLTPLGAAIKIFSFRINSVKALLISTQQHSIFLTATIARKRRRESNLTVGINVWLKSTPQTWENPRATSLALNLLSKPSKWYLTLNTYLLVTMLAPFGGKTVSYIPFNISAMISIVIAFFQSLL